MGTPPTNNNNNVDIPIVDTMPEPVQPVKRKRKLVNPAKVVVGGVKGSATLVVGGVKGSANVVKGGISQVDRGLTTVGGHVTKIPGVSTGMSIFADYKKFLDRGNVVDLAVAVVIGAAFTSIVTSLVTDIISPIISVASGKALDENFVLLRKDDNFQFPDYSTRASVKSSNGVSWNYGAFIQTVINFFIISACVFLIVKLYELGRKTGTPVVENTERKCPYCTKIVAITTIRCPNCTSWLDLAAYYTAELRLKDVMMLGPEKVLAREAAASQATAIAVAAGVGMSMAMNEKMLGDDGEYDGLELARQEDGEGDGLVESEGDAQGQDLSEIQIDSSYAPDVDASANVADLEVKNQF